MFSPERRPTQHETITKKWCAHHERSSRTFPEYVRVRVFLYEISRLMLHANDHNSNTAAKFNVALKRSQCKNKSHLYHTHTHFSPPSGWNIMCALWSSSDWTFLKMLMSFHLANFTYFIFRAFRSNFVVIFFAFESLWFLSLGVGAEKNSHKLGFFKLFVAPRPNVTQNRHRNLGNLPPHSHTTSFAMTHREHFSVVHWCDWAGWNSGWCCCIVCVNEDFILFNQDKTEAERYWKNKTKEKKMLPTFLDVCSWGLYGWDLVYFCPRQVRGWHRAVWVRDFFAILTIDHNFHTCENTGPWETHTISESCKGSQIPFLYRRLATLTELGPNDK